MKTAVSAARIAEFTHDQRWGYRSIGVINSPPDRKWGDRILLHKYSKTVKHLITEDESKKREETRIPWNFIDAVFDDWANTCRKATVNINKRRINIHLTVKNDYPLWYTTRGDLKATTLKNTIRISEAYKYFLRELRFLNGIQKLPPLVSI